MIVSGDSVKVYSVDRDRQDNQGKEIIANSSNREESRDLVSAYPRPIRSRRMED